MHASSEDLLRLRDGDADAGTKAHVQSCAECRAELERIEALRERLRSLPEVAPPEDRWPAVRRRMHERRLGGRAPLIAGLAAAASVVLAVTFLVRMELPGDGSPGLAAQAPDSVQSQSRQLERELRAVGDPAVMNGAEASLIAEIEDRIALVDLQLASGDMDGEAARQLWERRVELLMDLKSIKSEPMYVVDSNSYVL